MIRKLSKTAWKSSLPNTIQNLGSLNLIIFPKLQIPEMLGMLGRSAAIHQLNPRTTWENSSLSCLSWGIKCLDEQVASGYLLDLNVRTLRWIAKKRKNKLGTNTKHQNTLCDTLYWMNAITFPHRPQCIWGGFPYYLLLFGMTVTRNMNLVYLSLPNSLGTHGCDATIRRHWTWPWGSIKLESPRDRKDGTWNVLENSSEINLAKWNHISPTDRFPWNS